MTKRSDITASKKNFTTDPTPSTSTMSSSTTVSIPDPLPNSHQCVNTSSSLMLPVSNSSPLLIVPSNASGPTAHTNAPQPVGLPPLSWNPTLHSGMDQPLRAKSFGSTSELSSHPVGIPLSQPYLLPVPHQVHPGVSTSSSVVWPESPSSVNTPPAITVASKLVGCTSTPQPIGPPPLIQCAAPLASTAQVNIQAVPYLTPPQFLSPSQPCALQSPPLMGFPTAVSAHTTAALSQPFWVTFLTPRISRCQGKYTTGLHHWT